MRIRIPICVANEDEMVSVKRQNLTKELKVTGTRLIKTDLALMCPLILSTIDWMLRGVL